MVQDVISFHYKLTDKDGQEIDHSEPGHPLIFISGSGQIIPGLENLLVTLKAGDQRTITVLAKEAYGEYNKTLIYQVNRSKLPTTDIKIGDMFEVGEGEQTMPVSVITIDGDQITLDGNHPLSGKDLTFCVDVVERREATPQEVAHGHVHGALGCNH